MSTPHILIVEDDPKSRKLLRDVLTSDGRSLAQAALGWLWARSEATEPIPGFKTVAQVEDNVGALAYGPPSAEQMSEIAVITKR